MRRDTKRGRALRRLVPLALLLCAFLAAPAASETPVPTSYEVEGGPGGMTTAPDGSLWFVGGSYRLGRIKPDGKLEIVSWNFGGGWNLTMDADGNLWSATWQGIVRATQAGEVTQVPLPKALGEPSDLAAGPGGVWFTSWRRGKRLGSRGGFRGPAYVGRIAPGGQVESFLLPGKAEVRRLIPRGITLGPDGNLWVVDPSLGRIYRVSPSGRIATFKVPGSPYSLTAGPDGAMWFIGGDEIGRISPAGRVTRFPLPVDHGSRILTGPDGNLWFDAEHVGRMTPWGQVTLFRKVRGLGVTDMAAGRDGSIWVGTAANPIKYIPNGWIVKLATGQVGVGIASANVIVREGRFTLSLACGGSPTQGCSGEVRLGSKGTAPVLGAYALSPESRGMVELQLPAAAQRRLARQRLWRERIRVTVEGGVGAFDKVAFRLPRRGK